MIVLGLVLVAAAAVAGIEMFVSNTQETTAEAFDQTLTGVSLGGFFLAGALTTFVMLLGVAMISSGITRARQRRAERKDAEARLHEIEEHAEAERAAAVAEADRLRGELTRERMNQATLGGVVPPPEISDEPYPVETEPISDPEHSREDHRGVLGRLRKDRAEL